MAVKTITIDMDAYEMLAERKRPGESFSRVIKRIAGDERYSAHNLLAHLAEIALSNEALAAVDALVRDREKDYPDEPRMGQ
jgi:predicted CopG family antitoxin